MSIDRKKIRAEPEPDARSGSRGTGRERKGASIASTRNSKKGGEYMTLIRQILKNKGESVSDLHRKIGGNRGYLYEVCSGIRRATAPMREKISGALDLPEAALFDERGMARLEQ